MSEPEVALAFTADLWVEELHRHLTDHGGARVRTLLVEPEGAREESYDVLVAGHRWPALTRALVADVHAHGRTVVGVHDPDEPASREHLVGLGVDALVDSDAGADAFVRAISSVAGRRDDRSGSGLVAARRAGRLVTIGGCGGSGRTEIAIELALAVGRRLDVVLVDADDVAPAVSARLHMAIEPNVRTAIDAVEHGRGELDRCIVSDVDSGLRVITGLPNATVWGQVRPGEVIRVVDRVADQVAVVVVDGAGMLEDIPGDAVEDVSRRLARCVATSDVIVAVCHPSPHGIARLLSWAVDALALARDASVFVVVNRAPDERFRRGELFDEISESLAVVQVCFVPDDRRVADAAWSGTTVARGRFTRAVAGLADQIIESASGSRSRLAGLEAVT